jgi:N-acetylglucosamine-6-phosphate deacetylase
VNGFAGVDYCSPNAAAEEIGRSVRALYASGVTRFFPTVITGSPGHMLGAIRNLAQAKERIAEGAAIEGLHIEGPHISPEDGPRGAHPRQSVRPPDVEEFRRWQDAANGLIKLVTVSPEWEQTPVYVATIVREGVVAAIGHMNANGDQIRAAVDAGATLSTHLGNGAHSIMARHPNYLWEQLAEDRLAASFIVDGIHLDQAFLKTALRAKGVERSIIVTDAVMPAGCAPGPYMLGEVEVELKPPGDRVVLRGGDRLAGSALRMDDAIGNLVRMTGVSLRDAVTMATTNPARIGRIRARQRSLATGQRADLVVFRHEGGRLKVLETYVDGDRVFAAA